MKILTREQSLLAAIMADPDNIEPRLILADILQDKGGRSAARGEYIALACQTSPDGVRLRELLDHKDGQTNRFYWTPSPLRSNADIYRSCVWQNGFIEEFSVPKALFKDKFLRKTFRATPIRHVAINDISPRFIPNSTLWGWSTVSANATAEGFSDGNRPPLNLFFYLDGCIDGDTWPIRWYGSEELAWEALSRAAVKYGRQVAYLEPKS
jgi:uncharacterized protein (TIGR02996 family)